MNLNLDYIKPKDSTEQNREITVNIITSAISVAHKDGFDGNGPMRRMYGRMLNKFDEALDQKLDEVELEQGEKDLISKSLKDALLPVAWSRYIPLLEDELSK